MKLAIFIRTMPLQHFFFKYGDHLINTHFNIETNSFRSIASYIGNKFPYMASYTVSPFKLKDTTDRIHIHPGITIRNHYLCHNIQNLLVELRIERKKLLISYQKILNSQQQKSYKTQMWIH